MVGGVLFACSPDVTNAPPHGSRRDGAFVLNSYADNSAVGFDAFSVPWRCMAISCWACRVCRSRST